MTKKKETGKENKSTNSVKRPTFDFSSSKAGINPLLVNTPAEMLAVSSVMPSDARNNPLGNISEVEKRISTLMSEVQSKGKNASPIKQMTGYNQQSR